ncbi:MAG: TonB family protein [Bacteroidota bacterium]|nr:TonB family protein [Bacteroidota bacterium]
MKYLFVIIGAFVFFSADAQSGGLIYYLKNSGKLVASKDSADYYMVVLPPDTSVDKTMYVVCEYFKNGKLGLITGSKTKDINLLYQGKFITYFPNGKKKKIGNFVDGRQIGQEVAYYPNGNVHTVKDYQTDGTVFFRDCRDSTGSVLAENGNGKWIQFNSDYTVIIAKGNIENGIVKGKRIEKESDYKNHTLVNGKGGTLSSTIVDTPWAKPKYKGIEVVPEFPGGMEAFGKFLRKNIRYPYDAKQNGTQGNVIVSFIVEMDGSFTDMRVSRGIGDGCDEEALRVMKLMPRWKPGMQGGKAVRVAYSVPVYFHLTE